jgi:hypothetical protein
MAPKFDKLSPVDLYQPRWELAAPRRFNFDSSTPQNRIILQVKGKKFPVDVFSVSPLETDPGAQDWSPLVADFSRPLASRSSSPRRRRKRASVFMDDANQAKVGAKMKPMVGRKAALEQVRAFSTPEPAGLLSPGFLFLFRGLPAIAEHFKWPVTESRWGTQTVEAQKCLERA